MKYNFLSKLMVIATISSFNAIQVNAKVFTDQMALEDGMTPIEEATSDAYEQSQIMNFERSEYVTTIPSQEDIEKVVASHKQVIVVDKSVNGQTLKLYRDGKIQQLNELTLNPSTKKEELVAKDFVKVSTGTETKKTGASGRTYVATTPVGFFRPTMVYKMYYSKTWEADMPNAVFFRGGVAVHATSRSHYRDLGKRDSGGCVRTRLEVSEQIRKFVMETGLGTEPGQYGISKESYHRDRIINNTVSVDVLERYTGAITGAKVKSWDTVIVVHN